MMDPLVNYIQNQKGEPECTNAEDTGGKKYRKSEGSHACSCKVKTNWFPPSHNDLI